LSANSKDMSFYVILFGFRIALIIQRKHMGFFLICLPARKKRYVVVSILDLVLQVLHCKTLSKALRARSTLHH